MSIATDFELRLVDPADDTSILFDFNDPTGVNNPHGVQTWFGLGGVFTLDPPESEFTRFATTRDGQRTVRSRYGLGGVSWPQRILATDHATLLMAVGELSEMFKRGGSLWVRPKGLSDPRWLDIEPSDAPALYQGRPMDLTLIVNEFDTAQGVDLVLVRQPYFRHRVRDSITNILSNPTITRADAITGATPLGWEWNDPSGISNERIDPIEGAYVFDIATTSERNFRQTVIGGAAEPDVRASSVFVKVLAGTTARVRVTVVYMQGPSTVLATALGDQVIPAAGGTWQRLSILSDPAPAGTNRVRIQVRFNNTGAGASTVALRNGQLEADAVTPFVPSIQSMTTDDLLTVPIFIDGNAWAPVTVILRTNDAQAKTQEFVVGRRSDHGQPRDRAALAYQFGDWADLSAATLSNDTAIQSDSEAAGGSVAITTYASAPTVMAGRVRTGMPIQASQLRGSFDAYVRLRADDEGVHTIQLRWAPSGASPVPNSNDEVVHDTTGISDFGYVLLFLGHFEVPVNVQTLDDDVALELWSRRDSGVGSLLWNRLYLVPVDDPEPSTSRITTQPRSPEEWLGKDLVSPPASVSGDPTWVAGDVKGTAYRLNDDLEAVGTPPNAGLAWGTGRHHITFSFDPANTPKLTYKARVVNVTNGVVVVETAPGLTGLVLDGETPVPDTVLEFDGVAGKKYQAEFLLPAHISGSAILAGIRHEVIPYLTVDDAVLCDPENGVLAKVNLAEEYQHDLAIVGAVPLWCPPGFSVVHVHALDVPKANYVDPESVLDRTWRLGIRYAARDWV